MERTEPEEHRKGWIGCNNTGSESRLKKKKKDTGEKNFPSPNMQWHTYKGHNEMMTQGCGLVMESYWHIMVVKLWSTPLFYANKF